jgi:hypothetical protein
MAAGRELLIQAFDPIEFTTEVTDGLLDACDARFSIACKEPEQLEPIVDRAKCVREFPPALSGPKNAMLPEFEVRLGEELQRKRDDRRHKRRNENRMEEG